MDPAAAQPSDRGSSVSSPADKAVKGYSTVPSEDVEGATQDDVHGSGSTSFVRSRANKASTGYSPIPANDVEPSDVASLAVSGRGSGATGSTAVSRDDSQPSDGVSSIGSDPNKTTANYLGVPTDGAQTSDVESSLGGEKAATGPSAVPTAGVGNASQDPSQGRRASRLERVLLDTWIPETVAVTVSTCCLFAILGVCLYYNDKASPHMPYGITLNAVISILATTSRTMLIYTVAASISQLKWCWLKRSRKLQDLQTFDDASRGPWGSFILLVYLRARPLASIGAIITILALTLDPFVQQILTYPTRMVPTAKAVPTVSRALKFTTDPLSDPWLNAIEVGILSEPAEFDRRPECPTGDCEWPVFKSVGWCKKCQDVTQYATLSNCSFSAMGSNGNITGCIASIGHGPSVPLFHGLQHWTDITGNSNHTGVALVQDVVWSLRNTVPDRLNYPPPDFTALGVQNPLVSLGRVSLGPVSLGTLQNISFGTTETVPEIKQAEECILTLCRRDYRVTVRNGTATTSVMGNEDFGRLVYQTAVMSQIFTMWNQTWACWFPDVQANGGYTAETNASSFCPRWLRTYYPPNAQEVGSYATSILDSLVGKGTWYYRGPYTQTMNYTKPSARYIATTSLSEVLAGVEASLSRLALSANSVQVVGTALASEGYVHAALYWLALPLLLQVGGVALLILAVTESRRRGVEPWKESLLPVLFNGLESQFLNRLVVPEGTSALSVMADHIQIKLEYSTAQRKNILKAD